MITVRLVQSGLMVRPLPLLIFLAALVACEVQEEPLTGVLALDGALAADVINIGIPNEVLSYPLKFEFYTVDIREGKIIYPLGYRSEYNLVSYEQIVRVKPDIPATLTELYVYGYADINRNSKQDDSDYEFGYHYTSEPIHLFQQRKSLYNPSWEIKVPFRIDLCPRGGSPAVCNAFSRTVIKSDKCNPTPKTNVDDLIAKTIVDGDTAILWLPLDAQVYGTCFIDSNNNGDYDCDEYSFWWMDEFINGVSIPLSVTVKENGSVGGRTWYSSSGNLIECP